MNKIRLKRAEIQRDYLKVSELAHEIWRQHYKGILSSAQIEYMLEKFQSAKQIAIDSSGGYAYFILERIGTPVGYMGVKANDPAGKLFLSKIYILEEFRGKGYAKDALAQLEKRAQKFRQSAIWLTVNKNNPSYDIYLKLGFKKIREQTVDIGSGFVMDDYVMEKELPPQKSV